MSSSENFTQSAKHQMNGIFLLFPGPKVIKLFFMLNSAGHENFSANKYENANLSWHFHIY